MMLGAEGEILINHTALRKAKIVYNFGLSECSRVKRLQSQGVLMFIAAT